MKMPFARYAFAVVAVVALVVTLIRVTTAPERIKQHRDTAYSGCLANGGTWKVVDNAELCDKP